MFTKNTLRNVFRFLTLSEQFVCTVHLFNCSCQIVTIEQHILHIFAIGKVEGRSAT